MNYDITYKDGPRISDRIRGDLQRYIDNRELYSKSLRAILENNLSATVWHADADTLAQVPTIVTFLHWEAPAGCHGSAEIVKAWIEG